MNDKFFLDTNIIIYSFNKQEHTKAKIAKDLIMKALNNKGLGVVSYQVIQEFANVATKKFKKAMKLADLKLYLHHVLFPLNKVPSSNNLFESALEIYELYKYSFYDSLIIAAALESKCNILYSEDMQNEQKIGKLTILNPFSL